MSSLCLLTFVVLKAIAKTIGYLLLEASPVMMRALRFSTVVLQAPHIGLCWWNNMLRSTLPALLLSIHKALNMSVRRRTHSSFCVSQGLADSCVMQRNSKHV